MKKIIFLLLISVAAFAQDKILTTDSTGNTYVVFLQNDSTAVVYKGNHSAFVTDGIFAKNFSSFDLKFKGFMKWSLNGSTPEKPIDPIKPIDPPTDYETIAFPTEINYKNPRYWIEADTWAKVSANKSTIKNMNGYDFSPIVANQLENIYKYDAWSQDYISIIGKDVWVDDNSTYFLKPVGYTTDTQTNLMDFDLRFPDFKPPKNKIVVMQPTPIRDMGVYNYLKKGVTHTKNKIGEQGYLFLSDGWLIELGCPPAYTAPQKDFDKWCNEVDSDKLLKSFIENVYYPAKDYGYVMLNWEHVGHRWNVRRDKIIRCLQYWASHEHKAQMALWTVSSISMGKPIFQGTDKDYSNALSFTGSIEEFRQKFGSYISTDDSYAKYVEIGQVGGYMNYPIDDGIIHHYLFELLLNKKFYPERKIVSTVWFDQEFIDNFDLGRIKVESNDGTYFAQVKPKVFPSVAFNCGVWSMVGDGIDCWSDPNYWSENKNLWGWGAKDINGNDLPNKFGTNGEKYPAQPMKAIDWMMSGVWAMSENKDIIDAKGEFEFVKLPTKSFYDKSVLITYKQKGNEVLILAFDAFCKADEVKEHSFFIGKKEIKIKTYGRFTSIIRKEI